jgi:hypothetical protein
MTVQGALGLRENDAFWFVVMMLEHYDGLYREYPRKIGEETARAIEGAKELLAVAARMEAARAHRALAEEVAKTSADIAQKLAERPYRLHRVTAALAFLVLFGGICLSAGFKLATTRRPFWAGDEGQHRVISVVLSAPAGWMAFALLLPTAVYTFQKGLTNAKEGTDFRETMAAWMLLVVSAVAAVACAVMLVWMV